MKTKTYHLVAAVAASTDAAAFITIARDGYIVGHTMHISTTDTTSTHFFSGEISLNGHFQSATNDAQGIIAFMSLGPLVVITAIGQYWQYAHEALAGYAIPVRAGDRVYINTSQSAVLATYTVQLHVAE